MEKIIVSCLESRVEANRSIYARFLLGPFTDDHAVTIATALRRALLSKVKGTGITAIHIQGITHEFSTIAGIRESVLDLALNFQQIVLRIQRESQVNMYSTRKSLPRFLHGIPRTKSKERKRSSEYSTISHKKMDQRQSIRNQSREESLLSQFKTDGNTKLALKNKRLHFCNKVNNHFVTELPTKRRDLLSATTQIGYLQVQGPAVIYANDLKLPLGIECVDPTQYIATLSTEGLLVVKFLIGKKKVFLYKGTELLAKAKLLQGVSESEAFANPLTGTMLNQEASIPSFFVKHDHGTLIDKKFNTGMARLMQKRNKAIANKSIGVRRSGIEFQYMQNGVLQASQNKSGAFVSQRVPAALSNDVFLDGKKELRGDQTSLYQQFSGGASFSEHAKASLLQSPLSEQTSDFGKSGPISQEQDTASKGKIKGNFDEDKPSVLPFSFDNPGTTFRISTKKAKLLFKQGQQNDRKEQSSDNKVSGLYKSFASENGETFAKKQSSGFSETPPTDLRQSKPRIGFESTNYLRNTIFLDPILDSVSQVNYIIEKDDLSNQPRERIVLELWTNGSVHPRQAIHQASLSLMSTFSIFRKMFHMYSW